MVLGLKEGLVKWSTVCIKSEVILMLLWSFYVFAPIYICFKRENKERKAKEIIFLTLMLYRGWLITNGIILVAEKVGSLTETCFCSFVKKS